MAVGASTLLRPPSPWMMTGRPLACAEADQVVLVGLVQAADRALRQVGDGAAVAARHLDQGEQLGLVAEAGGDGTAVEIGVGRSGRRRQAGGAGGHGLGQHGRPSAPSRPAVAARSDGGFPHHPAAQVGVAHVAGHVDAETARAALEELGEGDELVPGDRRAGRSGSMFSTRAKMPQRNSRSSGLHGGDREAAVAGHDRGDAVEARHGGVGVEGQLRVVVGVHVDDARGDDQAVGVDLLPGLGVAEMAEPRHLPVPDTDVHPAPGQPRTVHDQAVADDQIEVADRLVGSFRHVTKVSEPIRSRERDGPTPEC